MVVLLSKFALDVSQIRWWSSLPNFWAFAHFDDVSGRYFYMFCYSVGLVFFLVLFFFIVVFPLEFSSMRF